jgi:uncharacterized membrane protein
MQKKSVLQGRKAKILILKDGLSSRLQGSPGNAIKVFLLIILFSYIIFTVYAILIPKEGARFTEFYILGEKGKAENYPTDFRVNQPETVIIGIHNHEYRNVTYTIEIFAAETTFDSITNTSLIKRMDFLERSQVTLSSDSVSLAPLQIVVPSTGYDKIIFLLFIDMVPPDTLIGSHRADSSYLKLDLAISTKND